ncbi:hypothetical protein NOVO_04075 [Rickettsiales bacterium Ac37b]|nr:hypothetical protein NOVO_04075 [Rickettsiales bacterium Ac37b]
MHQNNTTSIFSSISKDVQSTLSHITNNVKNIMAKSSPNNFLKNMHDVVVSTSAFILNKANIFNLISKDSLKWYVNYAFFGLEIRGLKSLLPSLGESFLPNIISKHMSGIIVGATIQGNSECSWQVKLASTSPVLGALVGGIHGGICCATISSAMNTFESLAPDEYKVHAKMLGFIATTSLASHVMCFNEKFIYNWHQEGFKHAMNEANSHLSENVKSFVQKLKFEKAEPVKASCCCK